MNVLNHTLWATVKRTFTCNVWWGLIWNNTAWSAYCLWTELCCVNKSRFIFWTGLFPAFVGCDGKFFGELMEELAEVVGCFNTRAQQLLELHLASGFRKYLLRLKSSRPQDREAMIQEGQVLLSYAFLNATAVRKILKKYDKVRNFKLDIVPCFSLVLVLTCSN